MKIIALVLTFLTTITTAHAQGVLISEIMPNPEGKDKNREWIELYNKGDKTIKLDGWQLENKKTQIISGAISAKGYLILENLKITLKNKEDHVRLLDNNGSLIDEVQYQNAKNNKSFSRIEISGQYLWQWGEPTKDSPNPTIHEISINSADLPLDYFDKKNAALLKLITSKNRSLQLLVERNNDNLLVHDVKIENPLTTKLKTWSETWVYYFLIASSWLLFLIIGSLKAIPLSASPHK